MLISSVLHSTDGAISLMQAVDSLNLIAITALMLVLVVTGVGVLHFVLEFVFGVSLENYNVIRHSIFVQCHVC